MPEWIFTFGVDHVHPTTQEPLGRRFVRITADSCEDARREMVRRWGQKWAFQYPTEDAAGVSKYALTEL